MVCARQCTRVCFNQPNDRRYIKETLSARSLFSRQYLYKDNEVCQAEGITIDSNVFGFSLSPFKYYCPVTWRTAKILHKCKYDPQWALLYKDAFYYFKGQSERDIFSKNPERFIQNTSFPTELPKRVKPHKASEIFSQEKGLAGYCPVSLVDEERIEKGDSLYLAIYKEVKFIFESEEKLARFMQNPTRYAKATLPVKMPAPKDKVPLINLAKTSLEQIEDSLPFLEQAMGEIVTRALLEIGCNRLKYPTLSVRETTLKLFALFLKANNPTNTTYMKQKYDKKIKLFIERCEMPVELYKLGKEKSKL